MATNTKINVTGEIVAVTTKDHEKYPSKTLILKFTSGNYEKYIGVEFTGQNMEKVDGLREGTTVDVTAYVSGSLYTDKNGDKAVFNKISGTDVSIQTGAARQSAPHVPQASQDNNGWIDGDGSQVDDSSLPF